ncbi:MAG: cysteine desulfurase [Erysipelotrichaceae bacterium]|nr:cysteine desulfurase [Erysipelotrichaceae bacterium]
MIYLDYVATTPLSDDIYQTYTQLLKKYFANADSAYRLGYEVNRLMETSRAKIASMLHVKEDELIFTSCASEANNLAIKGVAFQYQNRGRHIITTAIEHSSVANTCRELAEVFGFEVDYLSVDNQGHIDLEELKSLIRPDTILVTTMYVNNEIGVINPIKDIAKIIKTVNPKTKYHVDMVQALGKLPVDLNDIDLATFSAHKIFGLKGSGLLYKKHSTTLVPLINGGQQEFDLRGGTSNACTNIVLAKTIRLALESQKAHYDYVKKLNDFMREEIKKREALVINSPEDASPFILNISAPHYKPEVLVHDLESSGIYISTKSACSSKATEASHTLAAMHLDEEVAISALRLSFSHLTTMDELKTFLKALDESLTRVRKQR